MHQIQRGAGLNNTAFAEAISTTPSKLSKSYNGDRKFTTTELAIAASVGNTSVDWILTGKHSRTPRIAARTAQVVEGQHDDALAVVDRYTRAARQIEMIDGPRDLPVLPKLDESPLFVVQAPKLAQDALDMMHSAGQDIHGGDLADALEKTFGIDVAVTSLPRGVSGCSWQTSSIRFIAIGRSEVKVRQRFTLAHELGHILADDAQQVIEDNGSHSTTDSPIIERRADVFAANFLMPDTELREQFSSGVNDSTFAQGVARFGVSALALSWRLVNAGLLNSSEQPMWGGAQDGRGTWAGGSHW